MLLGSGKVDSTLVAAKGIWLPAPDEVAYRWFADGTEISGATGATYKVRRDDVGKKITVAISGTRAGYAPLTLTSNGIVARR